MNEQSHLINCILNYLQVRDTLQCTVWTLSRSDTSENATVKGRENLTLQWQRVCCLLACLVGKTKIYPLSGLHFFCFCIPPRPNTYTRKAKPTPKLAFCILFCILCFAFYDLQFAFCALRFVVLCFVLRFVFCFAFCVVLCFPFSFVFCVDKSKSYPYCGWWKSTLYCY